MRGFFSRGGIEVWGKREKGREKKSLSSFKELFCQAKPPNLGLGNHGERLRGGKERENENLLFFEETDGRLSFDDVEGKLEVGGPLSLTLSLPVFF